MCTALVLVGILYAAWSYKRTEVWCGKTTTLDGRPQPDLSLWTSAVETDPEDTFALSNLALVYLRFNPPKADQALVYLNRTLQLSQANQAKIAGGKQLDLSPIYQDLGEAYLARASGLAAGTPGSDVWRQRKEAYVESAKSFALASQNLSGFAPSDARLFSRLAEVYEGQAEMDAQDLVGAFVRMFPRFGLSSEDLAGQLFVGNHPLVEDGWQGQLRGLAIYDRVLTEVQVRQHYNAWTTNQNAEIKNEGPIALYLFNEGSGSIVHNQMNSENDLRIPRHFFVLHAPFLETPWDEFQPGWGYCKNVLINIAGFVPLGFFFLRVFCDSAPP